MDFYFLNSSGEEKEFVSLKRETTFRNFLKKVRRGVKRNIFFELKECSSAPPQRLVISRWISSGRNGDIEEEFFYEYYLFPFQIRGGKFKKVFVLFKKSLILTDPKGRKKNISWWVKSKIPPELEKILLS